MKETRKTHKIKFLFFLAKMTIEIGEGFKTQATHLCQSRIQHQFITF